MKRVFFAFLLLALATPLLADDCGAMTQLATLYELRHVAIRHSYDVDSWIDKRIDVLREPVDGGFRWVRWVRPSNGDPADKHLHKTQAVHGSGSDPFEASGSHAYGVRVVVPAKQSLFGRNNPVYVGTVKISYDVDGRRRTKTEAINQWMNPDTSRTIDLGAIADHVEASLDASTAQKDVNSALVEIHFREAVAEDDPANPGYRTIQSLRRVRNSWTSDAIDEEIARVERDVFGVTESVPLMSIVRDLRKADDLMRSNKDADKEKGKELMKDTLRKLRY
ncbi:MAG TPA: hypothetical protein VI670_03010 [Thermoanaerobaculia bacterium]|jgi:hypothetical protein